MEKFPNNEEAVEGEGFTVRSGSQKGVGPDVTRVEFRPGESTDQAITEKETTRIRELDQQKDWTDADHAEDQLNNMLQGAEGSYSETFTINPDGTFDRVLRPDGRPVYLSYSDTPADLYKLAAEIEQKHPEYHFNFETDPEGKWMKYTVSKEKV